MFAVPARVDGRRIIIDFPCLSCGEKMYFSYDERNESSGLRNASFDHNHSFFFVIPLKNIDEIPVDEVGYLIDDTQPGWEASIPTWLLELRAA